MSAPVSQYTGLITSEHQKPDFVAVISALVQGQADNQTLLNNLANYFDLDTAIGAQLDIIGLWVGISRNLDVPLTGVYFSWGTLGVGWGQGTWKGPYDPSDQLDSLPDDAYRTLIRAKIGANNWDGTVPGAYTIWNTLFAGTGYSVLIQDNQDMSMEYALLGPVPDAVTLALFENGYLNIKPAGVRINNYWTPSEPNVPYFGWGVENTSISGWGVGAWGQKTPNTLSVPRAGLTAEVLTGGTPVDAVNTFPNGGLIINPSTANAQGIAEAEPLIVNPVTAAGLSANDTNFALQPGQSWDVIPGQSTKTSVNAATGGHKFFVIVW